MKAFIQSVIIGGIIALACGCSKKPAASTPEAAVISTPAGTFDLAGVDKAVKEKNYDGALQILAQVKAQYAILDDTQRGAFQQKVRETASALMDLQSTDPNAKAAYDRLGKIAKGR